MSEHTETEQAFGNGQPKSADELLPVLYDQLRRLAAHKLSRESPGQTLQPTALVHEAWLRLSRDSAPKWNDRSHFFAAAAQAMRRILIENARRKRAIRHGGGQQRVEVGEIASPDEMKAEELLALDEALEKLSTFDPIRAHVVKLRFFAGLTNEEAAEILAIAVPTAKRYWAYARAWLYREMKRSATSCRKRGEA